MKRILLTIFAILIFGSLLIWWIGIDKIVIKMITPNHHFSVEKTPPAPDYGQEDNWAALPLKEDYADFRPKGIPPADSLLQAVDVFFIHPTGYFLGKLWNDPIDLTSGTTKKTDKLIANNASIFNDCQVYAPRYRQATIVTFLNKTGDNEQKALALAYQDIRSAFQYFLKYYHQGRPFILAGHSQGGYHGKLLIDEFIDRQPLAQKLVAAYLLGNADVTKEWVANLKNINVCDSASQTQCVINFNTFADDVKPAAEWESSEVVCVNPLNWRQDGALAPKNMHLGYVLETGDKNINFFGADEPDEFPIAPLQAPLLHHTYAKCDQGALLIENQHLENELMEGNYHGIELSLFHMNIRANVKERGMAYLTKFKKILYSSNLESSKPPEIPPPPLFVD